MISDFSSRKGGVTVSIETNEVVDIPTVEEVVVETAEYTLALTERKDIEYSDYSITFEEFSAMVDNLVQVRDRLKKELGE